jgi:hypothetical protein
MSNFVFKSSLLLALLLIPVFVQAQGSGRFGRPFDYDKSSAYMLIGYIGGPSFEEYVDWANNAYEDLYGSPEKLDDFGGAVCFTIGLRSRFSRYFALEVDFLTSTKKAEVSYSIPNEPPIPQELDLTIGAISFSIPIIFQFSNQQLIVPFVAAGVTVFPLRLDHRPFRHTKTVLAGNFAAGLESQIASRWWLSARIDWTFGKANMPVTQTFQPPSYDKYEMDLSTTQIQLGVLRGIY